MRARRFTLLLLIYVSLDLTNPFIQGAFSFNPDDSVEGISRHHRGGAPVPSTADTPATAIEPAPTDRAAAIARRLPSRHHALGEWLVDVREAHAALADPQSPTDDH
jgi:hypothetical protein